MPKKRGGQRNDHSFKKISQCLEKLSMADIAAELDKDLARGLTPDDLRKKYAPRMTARSIMMGLASDNELVATTNIKDVTDRTEGKASEKSRIPNPLEKLTDSQLEALLRTEIDDLGNTTSEIH